jgi:hypothetical protein
LKDSFEVLSDAGNSLAYSNGSSTFSIRLLTKATFLKKWAPNFSKYGPAGGQVTLPPPQEQPDEGRVPDGLRVADRSSDPKCIRELTGRKRRPMFLGLGFVLLLLWLGGFFVFHITAFFIHILLILAVISIIFHFMRGTASAV